MRAADGIDKLNHTSKGGGFISPDAVFIALITVLFVLCICRNLVREGSSGI